MLRRENETDYLTVPFAHHRPIPLEGSVKKIAPIG